MLNRLQVLFYVLVLASILSIVAFFAALSSHKVVINQANHKNKVSTKQQDWTKTGGGGVAGGGVSPALRSVPNGRVRNMPRGVTQNGGFNTTDKAPTIESAYRRDGYGRMSLMEKTDTLRPLYKFTLTPWKIRCEDEETSSSQVSWSMIISVNSESGHRQRREVIRKTWGSYKVLNGVQLRVMFVVGLGRDAESERNVVQESNKHGDLLQIKQEEVYKDIGYKNLAAMQWVGDHCPEHWIYSCSGDDTIPLLHSLFRHMEASMQLSTSKSLLRNKILPIFCGTEFRACSVPSRSNSSKNYAPESVYSGAVYPPFCTGVFYSMPVRLSTAIYRLSRQHKYFYNDDVWITGLLRLALVDTREISCEDVRSEFCLISEDDHHDVKHFPDFMGLYAYWGKVEEKINQKV